jgi:tetratricopeptide (TPR) repeat protein
LVPFCFYALGSIYAQQAQYEAALDNFKKAIDLGKSDLPGQAAIAIADIYIKQEKYDLALATYKEAIQQYTNLGSLIYPKMADLYFKIGKYQEAEELYRKSLERVPVREMSSIQFEIAQALQAQGKIQEAIEEYLKVTYLYSEDNALAVKSLLRVAGIYEDKENFKEALNIYKRITALNTEEAKYARERIDWIKAHIK